MALGQGGGIGGGGVGGTTQASPPDPVVGAFGEMVTRIDFSYNQFVVTGGEAAAEPTLFIIGVSFEATVTLPGDPGDPGPGPVPTDPGPAPAPADPFARFPTVWVPETESLTEIWTPDDSIKGI